MVPSWPSLVPVSCVSRASLVCLSCISHVPVVPLSCASHASFVCLSCMSRVSLMENKHNKNKTTKLQVVSPSRSGQRTCPPHRPNRDGETVAKRHGEGGLKPTACVPQERRMRARKQQKEPNLVPIGASIARELKPERPAAQSEHKKGSTKEGRGGAGRREPPESTAGNSGTRT